MVTMVTNCREEIRSPFETIRQKTLTARELLYVTLHATPRVDIAEDDGAAHREPEK